jgi:hypothetical protein
VHGTSGQCCIHRQFVAHETKRPLPRNRFSADCASREINDDERIGIRQALQIGRECAKFRAALMQVNILRVRFREQGIWLS